jgi:Mrp family chromosome partitioning ATPase
MTAGIGVLCRLLPTEAIENREAVGSAPVDARGSEWDPKRFADAQIRGLVRRVFVPGWPRPARQVVFSAADRGMDIAEVCFRTAETLACEGTQNVCLVETDLDGRPLEQRYGRTSNDGNVSVEATGAVRTSSRQIKKGVWLVPAVVFLGTPKNLHNPTVLRSRLGELRREFDYAVIHSASVGESEAESLLGSLADGLVLAVEAHRTRRRTALRIREHLLSANVRLLGVVLQDRTFPIPERLYHKL